MRGLYDPLLCTDGLWAVYKGTYFRGLWDPLSYTEELWAVYGSAHPVYARMTRLQITDYQSNHPLPPMSTASPPEYSSGDSLVYGIAVAVSILVFISTIMLASYACVRVKSGGGR
ncbi:putative RING-H2 finger protein ATL69 [Forsythia ovata]|uniref:RING-H2 finger protein ATL69 n=1 Tax=Forsythia ovata TaxID=205694 RepID=A0ABD1TPQ7_9LAMI